MSISIKEVLDSFNKIKDTLACPIDEGMVEPKLDYDDSIIIYCLSCSWKQHLGTAAQKRICDIAHSLD